MANNKTEKLRGGIAVLFGEAPATPNLTDKVQDIELKEALVKRQEGIASTTSTTGRRRGRPSEGRTKDLITVCAKVNRYQWAKFRTIAATQGIEQKVVLSKALDLVISAYEKECGEIKVNTGEKAKLFR